MDKLREVEASLQRLEAELEYLRELLWELLKEEGQVQRPELLKVSWANGWPNGAEFAMRLDSAPVKASAVTEAAAGHLRGGTWPGPMGPDRTNVTAPPSPLKHLPQTSSPCALETKKNPAPQPRRPEDGACEEGWDAKS